MSGPAPRNTYSADGYKAYDVGCTDNPDCPRNAAGRFGMPSSLLAAVLAVLAVLALFF